ncbi:MAG: signal recognition particle protein [Candidatus Ancillula sp.]|jgi:signal recognition particle subunit SRP54|nr:signal recognition particle protein [Candidatus Ancillula sp.]
MLDNISGSFTSAFKKLRGKGKLSQKDIDTVLEDIKRALIDADVAVSVVDEFLNDIREKASDIENSKSIKPAEQIVKLINTELENVLGQEVDRPLSRAKNNPTIYMLVGLQGAGKTTLAGKLGYWLKENGHTPLLVAADLQRPGAVKQLQVVGERAGVPVFAPNPGTGPDGEQLQKNTGGLSRLFGGRDSSKEPVKVAESAIKEADQKLYDTLIIDTAGRLGIDEELIKQAADIKKAVNPDEVLFVMDGTTGQDAVNSAKAFDEGVGFSASILTKMDSDARGGAALSLAKVTGKPILFQGVGEKFADLEVFHPDRIASRILDQGDILTLLENAEDKLDQEVALKSAQKIIQGEDFDLNDFQDQLAQIKKMGSIKSLLKMIPGMAAHAKQIEAFDEGSIKYVEAIISSMTPFERANPKQINGSRKQRIARGAGVEVSQINQLLERFGQTQKMMRKMMGGGKKKKTANFPQMPKGLDINALGNNMLNNGSDTNFDLNQMNQEMDSKLENDEMDMSQMKDLLGGMTNQMLGGFNSPMGGHGGGSSKRKSKGKKKKGKSGNPAKRAQEEALMRAKLGMN